MVYFKDMHYKRHITARLIENTKNSPAVLVAGARQTGKTTLVKEIKELERFPTYITFDDLFAQGAADADPIGFIENLEKPAILDEVQSAPQVFLPLKKDIDENRQAGRYILTGSANPLVIPKLGDSLAGRLQIVHLWPLSRGEILGRQEVFIDAIFSPELPSFASQRFDKSEGLSILTTGGYPALQDLKGDQACYDWCNGYLTTLIQKDMTDLAKIENLHSIPNVLQTLAIRTGALLNERDIARNVNIPISTLHRYLQLLQNLYLIFLLPGWYRNLGKRLIKSPKIYFVDSAILLHLLGFNADRLTTNPSMLGHILENFLVVEILKQISWSQTIARPYFYRTHDGSEEVDLVLESTSGKIVGIEIKNSETINVGDFKGLKQLQIETGKDFLRGILLYPGNKTQSFGKDLLAIPITTLWS
jgi:predicted AAA+ superfamily ATPase